ncbi:hypothetical protein ACFSLT_04340 [Novosphingobium resinovorum]
MLARQLSMPLDMPQIRGLTDAERSTVVAKLATLLTAAVAPRRRSRAMTGNNLIPATVLNRKAVVYVRQSTPGQVQNNLESQRRQYELVDVARRWGSVMSK